MLERGLWPMAKTDRPDSLALALEAARRATWDALQGPEHLRAGRYRPKASGPQANAADAAE